MKTLEELNALLTDLPCPFAAAGPGLDFPTAAGDAPAVNYETGIPQEYARDVAGSDSEESGELMPRADFNRLGNLATRELFFRRCGGLHTFDKAFSDENLGYAEGSLLYLTDEKARVFKPVESQEGGNDLDFATYPAVIDAEATKPSDGPAAKPRILWKSVGHVYGLAEGLAHFGVDFSRRQDVASGASVADDSLVLVGTSAWEYGIWDTESGIDSAALLAAIAIGGDIGTWENYFESLIVRSTCGTFKVQVSIGDKGYVFPCKGMQGGSFGCDSVVKQMAWSVLQDASIYYNRFCGGASFPLAFFAKKGAVVKYTAFGNDNEIADAVSCIAYPIETAVADGTEGGAE